MRRVRAPAQHRDGRTPPALVRHARGRWIPGLVLLALILMLSVHSASGQDRVMVQDISGYLEAGENVLYRLSDLAKGDMLYVSVKGVSGNLDPMVILFKPGIDFVQTKELFFSQLQEAIDRGDDPLIVTRELLAKLSLAGEDDRDGKYDPTLRFRVPANGTYTLLIGSAVGHRTFGKYRLLVGVNAPQVLSGQASPSGEKFVFLDRETSRTGKGVEDFTETLTRDKSFRLADFNAGDTLYVKVQATSGDLKPVVTLYDFGGKALAIANYTGRDATATLQHTFLRHMKNSRLKISGKLPDKTVTRGDYRVLLGVNSPEVLEGKAEGGGRGVLKKPIPVKIGVKMQQITHVDQKSENFGVVATLMLRWEDPALAFRPDTIHDRVKVYTGETFVRKMVEDGNLWPQFTVFNQQGNRWIQNSLVAVFSDGRVLYLERFSVTLQAPDFNFRRFPFDTQQFFIRVDSLLPERFFTFENMEGFSEAGKQLGEEEWIVTNYSTIIDQAEIAERPVSRFSFHFEAKRHLTYYAFRILLPVMIIIVVSWVIFFLKDYTKRIDASGANLLLFIAFNFAISNDLPRLGYMTFLDTILASVFVVTALMLILAVLLRRLVSDGREALVNRIDKYVVWFYPFAYIVALLIVILTSS